MFNNWNHSMLSLGLKQDKSIPGKFNYANVCSRFIKLCISAISRCNVKPRDRAYQHF